MTWQRSPRCYFQGQRALFGGWACGGVGITDPGKGCVFVFVCVVGWGDVGLSPTGGCQKPKKRHDPKAVLMECRLLPGQREGPEDQEASARRPAGTAPSLDLDEQGVQGGGALQIGLVVLLSAFLPRP